MEMAKSNFFSRSSRLGQKLFFEAIKTVVEGEKFGVTMQQKLFFFFGILMSAKCISDWLGFMAFAEARLSLGRIFFSSTCSLDLRASAHEEIF